MNTFCNLFYKPDKAEIDSMQPGEQQFDGFKIMTWGFYEGIPFPDNVS